MFRGSPTNTLALLLAAGLLCLAAAPVARAENGGDPATEPGEWCDPTVEVDCDAGGQDGGQNNGQDDDGWNDPDAVQPTPPTGPVATIGTDGRRARAPKGAPRIVRRAINAANRLTRKPYKWGGGHARLNDRGYDCSGAVSYVLRAISQLDGSVVSGSLKRWGLPNEGKWITVYANKGHTFMVIAGLRFDTSGYGEKGPRWRSEERSMERFAVRHPRGL